MNRPTRRIALVALLACGLLALAVTSAALSDPPSVSGLVSPTHPVASAWYANPNPTFSWRGLIATPAIAGYSYVLDGDPATVPDTVIDLLPFSFAPKRDVLVGLYPRALAIGDFNSDGKPDLAVLSRESASVSILLGKGNGSFAPRHSFAVAKASALIAVADLNRDGKPDLVIPVDPTLGKQSAVSVLLGNGDGTFAARHNYSLGHGDEAAHGEARALAIADLNGDHRLDIVTADYDHVRVLLGRGDGSFGAPHGSLVVAYSEIDSLALGDLNGDGAKDVVAGSQELANQPEGALSVLLNKGDGSFKAAVTHGTGVLLPDRLAVADVNHDGKRDLLVANDADVSDWYGQANYCAVVVYLGKGDGSFSKAAEYDFGQGDAAAFPTAFKVADFNADGNADLLVATGTGLDLLLGNGDGSFQAPVEFDSTNGVSAVVGDFNSDGKPDLAVAGLVGDTVSVFLNRSTRAAYHGLADGIWYFHVRAVDANAVGGPSATRAVRIDTQRPSTQAPSTASVQSGDIARLPYMVSDPPPCAGWCTAQIKVRDGHGTVKFSHTYGHAHSDVLYQAAFRCRLAKGVYHFSVYATDAAGNKQANVASNSLIVY
jgi:FG-GAP-like repeat